MIPHCRISVEPFVAREGETEKDAGVLSMHAESKGRPRDVGRVNTGLHVHGVTIPERSGCFASPSVGPSSVLLPLFREVYAWFIGV